MANLKVVDVSEHQGVLDWAMLAQQVDGAIIRCGYGDDETAQDDKQWARNVAACEKYGVPYGVYLYSYASDMAHVDSEIAHVLRLIKGHNLSFPAYIDLEETRYGGIAKQAANRFCKAVEKAGYTAGVYTFESYYNQFMNGYDAYTLWVAAFGANDGRPHVRPQIAANIDAWQYTSNARLEGYNGPLDMSTFYRDFPAEKGGGSSTPFEDSAPDNTARRVIEVARGEIGMTNGRKYGEWYEQTVDKNAANYDFGAQGVPWCAMFVSWCFAQAKAKCAGIPGAYCPSMLQAAKTAGKTVKKSQARRGDVVYFDWDNDGIADHVGIVRKNNAEKERMATIEGNTDDGICARKLRGYDTIIGVVRPDYGTAPTPTPTPTPQPVDKTVTFRLSTDTLGVRWLAAGKKGDAAKNAIRWLAIKGAKYRVCTAKSGWLPWVSAYNIKDLVDGCAGDGSPITAVQVDNNDMRYAVRVRGNIWYADMIGSYDTGGTSDNFAGDLQNAIDGFRIERVN